MIDLLKARREVIVAIFTDWLPIYQGAELGTIGTILGIFSLVSLGIVLIKKLK